MVEGVMHPPDAPLSRPPIVEAVVDIDCDLPPQFRIDALQVEATERLGDAYPNVRVRITHEHEFKLEPPNAPTWERVRDVLDALQFVQEDERQLVQFLPEGFSFNRLAPYTSLDEYLPEIERTWKVYAELCSPVQVTAVRLRFINRILLPFEDGNVALGRYLRVRPQLPEGPQLSLTGFLLQHTAVERESGNQVSLVVTAQPAEAGKLPVILDNTVAAPFPGDPGDWPWILSHLRALRSLKNEVFRSVVTDECLNLFR